MSAGGAAATRSPLRSGLDHELECAICKGLLLDPRVLSCQHTFCLRCLYTYSGRKQDLRASVQCPFCAEAGRTTTPGDIRTLRRNTIVTNLSQALRRRRFEEAKSGGEAVACDYCAAEQDLTLCPRCCTLLCPACQDNADHTYLCAAADDREPKPGRYPFFLGWAAAERALRSRLHVALGLRQPLVLEMGRIWAPFTLEQAVGSVSVGGMITQHEAPVPVYTSNALGPHREKVEQRGVVPLACTELAMLCQVQEVKSRQIAVLRSLELLLENGELRQHLNTHSARIRDDVAWDCGLASDVAFLADLLLAVHRLLCVPVDRKLHLLSALEGLADLERQAEERRAGLSRAQLEHACCQMRRQLDITTRQQRRLEEMCHTEQELARRLGRTVSGLLSQQHRAWLAWQSRSSVRDIPMSDLRLSGGATLGSTLAVDSDLDDAGEFQNAVQGISDGTAGLCYRAPTRGSYVLYATYRSRSETGLRAWVGQGPPGAGHARHAVCLRNLPPTGPVEAALCSFRLLLREGDNAICVGPLEQLGATSATTEILKLVVAPDESTLSRKSAEPQNAALASRHRQALAGVALLHQRQLELHMALERMHAEATRGRGDAAAAEADGNKRKVLSLCRSLQQVRTFHRQYFYYHISGRMAGEAGREQASGGRRAQDRHVSELWGADGASIYQPGIAPFPAVVPPLGQRNATASIPNLLQYLQPRIRELREEQQQHLLQEPPLQGALQEDIKSLLKQTLELLQQEQRLVLREGCQELSHALVAHMRYSGVPQLLDFVTDGAASGLQDVCLRGDVTDLDALQVLWAGYAVKINRGGGGGQLPRGGAQRAGAAAAAASPPRARATERDAGVAAGAAAGTRDFSAQVDFGPWEAPDDIGAEQLVHACASLLRVGDAAGQESAAAAAAGPARGSVRSDRWACREVLASLEEDISNVDQHQFCNVLGCAIVDGLTTYAELVMQQREQLEASLRSLIPLQEGAADPDALFQEQRSVSDTADCLELHLKVVELLRYALLLSQQLSPLHGQLRFELLGRVALTLHRLQLARGDSSSLSEQARDEAQRLLASAGQPRPPRAGPLEHFHAAATSAGLARYLCEAEEWGDMARSPASPSGQSAGEEPPTPMCSTRPAAHGVRWWLSTEGEDALAAAPDGAAPPQAQGQQLLSSLLCSAAFRSLRFTAARSIAPLDDLEQQDPPASPFAAPAKAPPNTRGEVRARAAAVGKRRWTLDLVCFGLCHQLLSQQGTSWGRNKYRVRDDEDAQPQRALAPFYWGRVSAREGGTQHDFVVNGQTGEVYCSARGASPLCFAFSAVHMLLRQRPVWILLNLTLLVSRFRSAGSSQ